MYVWGREMEGQRTGGVKVESVNCHSDGKGQPNSTV